MGRHEFFDVVVVGGGSGGFSAAVGAARTGAKTALIERYGFLGGTATVANVITYCGFIKAGDEGELVVDGIGGDLLRRQSDFGFPAAPRKSRLGNWNVTIDIEALKAAQDQMAEEAGVRVFLHSLMTGAEIENGAIKSIEVSDHTGTFKIFGGQFVDASGEGDLSHAAGAVDAAGPAVGKNLYAATFPVRLTSIEPGTHIDFDTIAGRANARLPDDCTAFIRQKSIVAPILESDDLWWMGIDVRTDGVSAASLSAAERDCRKALWAFIAELKTQSGCKNATPLISGPQVGIRESRHPHARAIVTGENAKSGCRRADGVARAAWPMESHDNPGKPIYAPIGGEGFFDIPLDAMRADGPDNLWLAGRLIGCDREAYASIRVMGTGFATGHAAGVGAALAARGELSIDAVRSELIKQRAII